MSTQATFIILGSGFDAEHYCSTGGSLSADYALESNRSVQVARRLLSKIEESAEPFVSELRILGRDYLDPDLPLAKKILWLNRYPNNTVLWINSTSGYVCPATLDELREDDDPDKDWSQIRYSDCWPAVRAQMLFLLDQFPRSDYRDGYVILYGNEYQGERAQTVEIVRDALRGNLYEVTPELVEAMDLMYGVPTD